MDQKQRMSDPCSSVPSVARLSVFAFLSALCASACDKSTGVRSEVDPAHDETSAKTGPAPARTSIDPARDAAFSYLAMQATRFPSLELAPLDSSALGTRDAAFAHAIV